MAARSGASSGSGQAWRRAARAVPQVGVREASHLAALLQGAEEIRGVGRKVVPSRAGALGGGGAAARACGASGAAARGLLLLLGLLLRDLLQEGLVVRDGQRLRRRLGLACPSTHAPVQHLHICTICMFFEIGLCVLTARVHDDPGKLVRRCGPELLIERLEVRTHSSLVLAIRLGNLLRSHSQPESQHTRHFLRLRVVESALGARGEALFRGAGVDLLEVPERDGGFGPLEGDGGSGLAPPRPALALFADGLLDLGEHGVVGGEHRLVGGGEQRLQQRLVLLERVPPRRHEGERLVQLVLLRECGGRLGGHHAVQHVGAQHVDVEAVLGGGVDQARPAAEAGLPQRRLDVVEVRVGKARLLGQPVVDLVRLARHDDQRRAGVRRLELLHRVARDARDRRRAVRLAGVVRLGLRVGGLPHALAQRLAHALGGVGVHNLDALDDGLRLVGHGLDPGLEGLGHPPGLRHIQADHRHGAFQDRRQLFRVLQRGDGSIRPITLLVRLRLRLRLRAVLLVLLGSLALPKASGGGQGRRQKPRHRLRAIDQPGVHLRARPALVVLDSDVGIRQRDAG